jgi:hypothetical protein
MLSYFIKVTTFLQRYLREILTYTHFDTGATPYDLDTTLPRLRDCAGGYYLGDHRGGGGGAIVAWYVSYNPMFFHF